MKNKTIFTGAALALSLGAFFGNAAFAAPSGFNDDAFYACIEEEYVRGQVVSNGGTSIPTELSAEQLASIITLSCNSKSITDIAGIEKLTNLKVLELRNNEIEEADLSANAKLEEINLDNNQLSSVVLPASATDVNINNNSVNLLELDASAAANLEMLNVNDTRFLGRTLDLSGKTKLKTLHASGTNLKSIYLPNSIRLKTVLTDAACAQGGQGAAPVCDEAPVLILNTRHKAIENTTNTAGGQQQTATTHELQLGDFVAPDGFIDESGIVSAAEGNDAYRFDSSLDVFTIAGEPDDIKGFIKLAGYNIYVPINDPGYVRDYLSATQRPPISVSTEGEDEGEDLDVPSTSTGTVEEAPEETKKENPDTSTASKLILGISFLGMAAVAMAVKAILSARARK